MESIDGVVGLREAVPSDLAYIYATWLKDLRAADPSPLPSDLWFTAHRALIDRILVDGRVAVKVICPLDAPNDIIGYVVAEPEEVLWWIHVRPQYRGKHGLAKLLLEQSRSLKSLTPWRSQKLLNPVRSRKLRTRYSSFFTPQETPTQ